MFSHTFATLKRIHLSYPLIQTAYPTISTSMFPSLVQAHTDTSNQRQVRSKSHGHEILSSALVTGLFNSVWLTVRQ